MKNPKPCMKHRGGWIDSVSERYSADGWFQVLVRETGSDDEVIEGEFAVNRRGVGFVTISVLYVSGVPHWHVFYYGLGPERGSGNYGSLEDILEDDGFIGQAEHARRGTKDAMHAVRQVADCVTWAK